MPPADRAARGLLLQPETLSYLRRLLLITCPAVLSLGCAMKHEEHLVPEGRACPARDAPGVAADLTASWFTPARGGDQKALAKWCATVGPAVIDSLPADRFGRWQPGDSLAVVT